MKGRKQLLPHKDVMLRSGFVDYFVVSDGWSDVESGSGLGTGGADLSLLRSRFYRLLTRYNIRENIRRCFLHFNKCIFYEKSYVFVIATVSHVTKEVRKGTK